MLYFTYLITQFIMANSRFNVQLPRRWDCIASAIFALIAAATPAASQPARPVAEAHHPITWPEGAVIDASEHGIVGDGKTDVTDVLQSLFNRFPNGSVIIYLPPGEYQVSDTIRWPDGPSGWEFKNVSLHGAGPGHTTLRLVDRATGFDDPSDPRPVIWTGEAAAQRFGINIRDLTIHTGNGNPGAIGAQYISNNSGTMREVIIRSGDNPGPIGLDMRYTTEVGPLLIKNVLIEGFIDGIRTGTGINSQTFEYVTLRGQRRYGWYNTGQVVSARKLTSENAGVAIRHDGGTMTLIDCTLRRSAGTESKQTPVRESDAALLYLGGGDVPAKLFVRNLNTPGYVSAIDHREIREDAVQVTYKHRENEDAAEPLSRYATLEPIPGPRVEEWSALPAVGPNGGMSVSLRLPIEETPELPWPEPGDFDDWADAVAFGATPTSQDGQDPYDGEAIQNAIDSGAKTVFLPNHGRANYPEGSGKYEVKRTLYVRGAVERLIGCEASITGDPYWEKAILVIADGDAPVVVIENIEGPKIIIDTDRTVVIRHCVIAVEQRGQGKIFLEDVCGDFTFRSGQKIWARQLNPEKVQKDAEVPHILNQSGDLWIMGLKTEGGGTLIETTDGGRTEVLGAHCYSTHNRGRQHEPLLVVRDAELSFVGSECQFVGESDAYKVYIHQVIKNAATLVGSQDLPSNYGWGRSIPLYSTKSVDSNPESVQ